MMGSVVDDLKGAFGAATSASNQIDKIGAQIEEDKQTVVIAASASLTLQAISTLAAVIVAVIAIRNNRR